MLCVNLGTDSLGILCRYRKFASCNKSCVYCVISDGPEIWNGENKAEISTEATSPPMFGKGL